jgi:hypothetical protein
MVPESAASMLNGSDGLLCVNEGGSTRRNGEDEARRLVMALMRLCFGEPRLLLMGVDFAVLDGVRILRVDRVEGVALSDTLFTGEETRLNLEGLMKSKSRVELVLDFLVGEAKTEGSMFSESASSKISGARWRLPIDVVGVGFMGESTWNEMAVGHAFRQARSEFLLGGFTILLVLRTLERLETRVAKLSKGLARNGSHGNECRSRKNGVR